MFFIWVALVLQSARSAEYKASHTVAANGDIESLQAGPGYVRRESRSSQDGSFVHQEPAVSKVVVSATEAVSNLTVKPGKGDQMVGVWKDESKEASTAMSLSFLASLGFILSVFYMVNSGNAALKVSTWKILVSSISLFSVVLLFMVLKKSWKMMMGTSESDEAKLISDVISAIRFLLLWFLVPFLLKRKMENETLKESIRLIGVPLLGFAGADAFTDILKQDAFASSQYIYLVGVLCVSVLLGALQWATRKLRLRWTSSGDEAEGAGAGGWTTLVEDMELESTAFIVSFLFSMWARFCVTGAVPGARYSRKITGDDVNWLFCFVIVVVVLAAAALYVPVESFSSLFIQKLMRTSIRVLWMTFGWLVFFLCQWLLWNMTADDAGAHHTSKLIAANGLALVGTVLIFFPMVSAHLMGRSSCLSSGLFIGVASLILAFSWETAVYMAVQGASETVEGDTMQKLVATIMIVLILGIILPGWYIYMLPLARAEADEAKAAEGDAPAPAAAPEPAS
ncbi:unnamed protein product [Durusdinium trenchii]|uniref:Uncharacterized protein n=1 Tax=Durusdinium trenchii TaxID=1381693 RepID=A0ABP0K488_9DINO